MLVCADPKYINLVIGQFGPLATPEKVAALPGNWPHEGHFWISAHVFPVHIHPWWRLRDRLKAMILMQRLSSHDGRSYAVAGGVVQAIIHDIKQKRPDCEVPFMQADNLHDYLNILQLADNSRTPGHILEGLACPGGCVGGPGNLIQINRARKSVKAFSQLSPFETATGSAAGRT